MIKREMEDGGICVLTFDRPESGANIFDAATMDSLRGHLDAIENDDAIKGVIVASAKKSIFIAGADLQTLLRQAQTGELRAFIAAGQKVFNRLEALKGADGFAHSRRLRRAVDTRSRWRVITASLRANRRRGLVYRRRRSVWCRLGVGRPAYRVCLGWKRPRKSF